VYVSHVTRSDTRQETRLLQLIHFLAQYGIRLTLDLLCQVEINNAGGLPNWIPETISKADKILLYLSKSYIAVSCTLFFLKSK